MKIKDIRQYWEIIDDISILPKTLKKSLLSQFTEQARDEYFASIENTSMGITKEMHYRLIENLKNLPAGLKNKIVKHCR